MAQAVINLKLTPMEFQVLQEAMIQYLANLTGDDPGTRYRKSYTQGLLSGAGIGTMPDITQTGQLSFNERFQTNGYDPDDDNEPEEEEVPEAETEEAATVEGPAAEAETTEAQGEPVEVA